MTTAAQSQEASLRQEWRTPPELMTALRREFDDLLPNKDNHAILREPDMNAILKCDTLCAATDSGSSNARDIPPIGVHVRPSVATSIWSLT